MRPETAEVVRRMIRLKEEGYHEENTRVLGGDLLRLYRRLAVSMGDANPEDRRIVRRGMQDLIELRGVVSNDGYTSRWMETYLFLTDFFEFEAKQAGISA